MWFSTKLFDLFKISKDAVDDLRKENAVLKSDNLNLTRNFADVKANFEWIRVRVNALELERASLLEKVYGLKVPSPEILRTTPSHPIPDFNTDIFNDMGDDAAKMVGLPTWKS